GRGPAADGDARVPQRPARQRWRPAGAAARGAVKPVRVAAAEVLLAIEGRRTTLAAELETARDDLPDPRDRALLIEIASGTLRWQNAIDARLAIASRRAVGSFDVVARAVLRLGAYQLGYLTRVPAHA